MNINLKIDGLCYTDEEAFDLLYFALRAEYERQRKIGDEFIKNYKGDETPVNVNCVMLLNMLEQLKEKFPATYLVSEQIYNDKLNS
jgi:hypothetical protein